MRSIKKIFISMLTSLLCLCLTFSINLMAIQAQTLEVLDQLGAGYMDGIVGL